MAKHVVELTQPITARSVLVAARGEGLAEDEYHALLLSGATALERQGLCHWHYVAAWPSWTLWRSPTPVEGRHRTLAADATGGLR